MMPPGDLVSRAGGELVLQKKEAKHFLISFDVDLVTETWFSDLYLGIWFPCGRSRFSHKQNIPRYAKQLQTLRESIER